ncbi:MAG: MmcQ/YjbR family DNA-binding protein [Deltaproteobacteria bacterium]
MATKKSTTRAASAKEAVHRPAPPPRKPVSHPVQQTSARDAPLVERLRKICLGFPEAGERLSHGEPTWFAGKGRVFAMLDNHHHGSRHLSVWLPQPTDAQETLMDADPERFFRPPYVGPSGWVGVVLDTKPDWKMVQRLVRDAFALVATKKLLAQLDDEAPTTKTDPPISPSSLRSRRRFA